MKSLLILSAIISLPELPAATVLGTMNGHTYTLYGDAEKATYADALAAASNAGGHLLRITSSAENETILSWLQAASLLSTANDGGGARYVWLGADDRDTEGTWKWASNQETFWQGDGATGSMIGSSYSNWGSYTVTLTLPEFDIFDATTVFEPDDYGDNQDAAAFALESWPTAAAMPDEDPFFYTRALPGQWNDLDANNQLPFIVMTPVPEPSSVLCVGFSSLLMLRRRRSA